MKISFLLFLILIQDYFSNAPNWNVTTSLTDLLPSGTTSITYTIDERKGWYAADDKLEKTITKTSEGITLENKYILKANYGGATKFSGEVEFESIESFYLNVDGETSNPIICPKGSYNPYEILGGTSIQEIEHYSSTWITNSKFELKCYYHRHGPFLVFYLMNKESYVLRL